MTHEPQTDSLATRRGVLAGVGLVGLASAITACGAGGSSSYAGGRRGDDPGGAAASSGTGERRAAARAAPRPGTRSPRTSQIPVGSGMIFSGPAGGRHPAVSGEFKAFSAVCTHMGCIVNQISNGTIDCPCHGSQYSIKTGDVVAGPAPKPLPAKQIKVSGDSIFLE